LLSALSDLAAFQPELATVVVSHHLEDLPPRTSHAMLLAGGGIVASGPVERALTEETVSACFGLPVHLRRHGGRWAAVGGHDAGAMASPPAPAR
jgi:iron complex transport system ATP-binding protein